MKKNEKSALKASLQESVSQVNREARLWSEHERQLRRMLAEVDGPHARERGEALRRRLSRLHDMLDSEVEMAPMSKNMTCRESIEWVLAAEPMDSFTVPEMGRRFRSLGIRNFGREAMRLALNRMVDEGQLGLTPGCRGRAGIYHRLNT